MAKKDSVKKRYFDRIKKFKWANNIDKNDARPASGAGQGNDKLKIKDEILEIDVPENLKMSELKLNEEKSEKEVVNIAGLLTSWYAVKARGKK